MKISSKCVLCLLGRPICADKIAMTFRQRFLVIILSVLILFSPKQLRAHDHEFDIKTTDHQLHMLSTYAISLTFTSFLTSRKVPRWKAVLLSSLTTLALGYGKEKLVDSQYSPGDMIANGIGVGAQALVVFTFEL